MSRVKGRDTGLERRIRSALHRRGLRFSKHAKDLPGRPDVVFRRQRVAVFLDGDFWHGFRYPLWALTLTPFWRTKIELNRKRDARNFRKLRRAGWVVVRIWQHQAKRDLELCVDRIVAAVQRRG
jgi:DNA mismatch endonuclease (patch repair protein)